MIGILDTSIAPQVPLPGSGCFLTGGMAFAEGLTHVSVHA